MRGETPVSDRRVLFFGDSHVVGVGDPEGLGWVGRVAAASARQGLPFTPYNLGVRRETSIEIGARWQVEAAVRLSQEAECRLVFSFGLNDATREGDGLRVEPSDSLAALGAILDGAAVLGLPVLFVGPAPVADKEQTARTGALSDSFAMLCRERGVPFVDVIAQLQSSGIWMREVAADDGAHPGARGYELLASAVLSAGWIEWLTGKRAQGA